MSHMTTAVPDSVVRPLTLEEARVITGGGPPLSFGLALFGAFQAGFVFGYRELGPALFG